MIAVIDYKAGNLTSVVKALGYLGARDVVVTQSPEVVRAGGQDCAAGGGAFSGDAVVGGPGADGGGTRERIAEGAPFLGICVGLQWLYEGSTEAPATEGLWHFASAV